MAFLMHGGTIWQKWSTVGTQLGCGASFDMTPSFPQSKSRLASTKLCWLSAWFHRRTGLAGTVRKISCVPVTWNVFSASRRIWHNENYNFLIWSMASMGLDTLTCCSWRLVKSLWIRSGAFVPPIKEAPNRHKLWNLVAKTALSPWIWKLNYS